MSDLSRGTRALAEVDLVPATLSSLTVSVSECGKAERTLAPIACSKSKCFLHLPYVDVLEVGCCHFDNLSPMALSEPRAACELLA